LRAWRARRLFSQRDELRDRCTSQRSAACSTWVPRQADFVSHPERCSVGSRRAAWNPEVLAAWDPFLRTGRRDFCCSPLPDCSLPVDHRAEAPWLFSTCPAQTLSRRRKAWAFLPLPPKRERFSVSRGLLSKHTRRGKPCGRRTHGRLEEPPRPFRRARHEDGPAVSDCLPRTLERATRLSSGSS
jgi:hypothetical protein